MDLSSDDISNKAGDNMIDYMLLLRYWSQQYFIRCYIKKTNKNKKRMRTWLLVMALVGSALADCSKYMTNEELNDYLIATATLEPNLTSVYSIGFNNMEMEILVLELSAAEPSEQVPNLKFIGGIHGNEPIGSQILISFIEYLVDGYRREERFVTWLLNNTRIHILPRLNMEGFQLAIEGVCNLGLGRENSDGYDLNRVFKPQLSEIFIPEVDAVMTWLSNKEFVLSAAVHAGEMVVVYPPDDIDNNGGQSTTPDDDVFQHLALVYATNHRNMSIGDGCNHNKFKNGTVNGATWYPVKGSMQDYNYLNGTMELTLEISCCKYPPSDQICNIWEDNKLALLKLAAESCRGVRGKVTSLGNVVVGASVSVLGRNMTVRTNDQGYYFRILLPGRYFIKVESIGLKTFIKEFVVPRSETAALEWTVLDIQLESESAQVATNHGAGHSYSTEPTANQTGSYDKGGLDPDMILTYDDSYLSSPNDSQIRWREVKGTGHTIGQSNICFLVSCILCTYLVFVLTGFC